MAQRYVVVGKQPILDRKRGEHVYLEDDHATRLMSAGHVAPAPPPAPKRAAKKTHKPRETPGLVHVQESAAAAAEDKE